MSNDLSNLTLSEIMSRAVAKKVAIPGFNIPYLPMMEPVVKALRDADAFGLVMVARLEWVKFESQGVKPIRDEYQKWQDSNHTRLHLDHVPVIDEDNQRVDFESIIGEAVELGYHSVMVDGSRLPLEENIAATKRIVEIAGTDIPVEGELGAVLGHESGPMPPYEELFASGKGFTDPAEAKLFVERSGVSWLSVAIGNIHGAISAGLKDKEKPTARLNLDHLREIRRQADTPLVLHGGTGIPAAQVLEAVRSGVSKINVATAIRQPYERELKNSVPAAQDAVYKAMMKTIDELELRGSASLLSE